MPESHFQTQLFPVAEPVISDATSTTFADNRRLPVHRWFRYSAGFSGAWAGHVIQESMQVRDTRVLDPFAGVGTTLLAAEDSGVPAYGVEAHPFVHRVAQAKLARCTDPAKYWSLVERIQEDARKRVPILSQYPKLIRTCFTDETLSGLDCLHQAVMDINDDTPAAQLAWLTLAGVLRRCSHAGTAQWQYVLPRKSKRNPAQPSAAFDEMSRMIVADMATTAINHDVRAELVAGDARDCEGVPDHFATLVVTSPPYPNNYDYADATRLELSFFGEISRWSDLQWHVRRHLLRSCTQHVPEKTIDLQQVLRDPLLDPIRADIAAVCEELAEVRKTKGGKKTYHLMVACYFLDLARVWKALRRACDTHCKVCFVIGDSAPYGVYVPVIDWLGRLALASGFDSFSFERTRDRNVKWKNRKHRVPLCEGRLWVEG